MKTVAEMGFDPRVIRIKINDLPDIKRTSACAYCSLGPLSKTVKGCSDDCGPNHVFFDPVIYAIKRLQDTT